MVNELKLFKKYGKQIDYSLFFDEIGFYQIAQKSTTVFWIIIHIKCIKIWKENVFNSCIDE